MTRTDQLEIDFETKGATLMNEAQKVEQTRFLLQFIAAGIKVLSARVSMLLALTLTFILFAWAMAQPDVWRFAGATVFAILIFLPAVWLDVRAATKE